MKTDPRSRAENLLCTLTHYAVCSDCMGALQHSTGAFQKVGECLYRYSNGLYYARIRVEGKEIKRSLGTTDPALARRKLAQFKNEQRQIDRSQGKLTLDALCGRYLLTIQHQKPKRRSIEEAFLGRNRSLTWRRSWNFSPMIS